MIDPVCWREDNVVVARLAKISGLDMCRVLPDCGGAVVATKAVIGDVYVIKGLAGTQPAVVWQSSQVSALAICVGSLPIATEPL